MTWKATNSVMRPEEQWFSIGEAARRLGIAVPTIRLYEREGLILPRRKHSGHRVFSDSDLERIRCIRRTINERKISIAGIRMMLSLIPCWSLKGCPPEARASCEAVATTGTPCWSIRAKPWRCGTGACRDCFVYAQVGDCAPLKRAIVDVTLARTSTMPRYAP